jgi:glutaminyl-tRNA synthetase
MAVERDFIRDIIENDLRSGRHTKVATRFPPEPNGYLHIGHAKSICLNFGIARDYQGTCNLRYDDTNPEKEETEYVESIEHDVRWLGFAPTAVLFSADYFPKMYELAERLVMEGKAYVCDLSEDDIKKYRGSLSEPGKASPFRDRSAAENLAKLRDMKAGKLPNNACTLRAKIDMASPNMKMRDPLLYRIRHEEHHRSGTQWCIYPMYDYAHPIEDAIEGITHSICTLEFENNRELYDWVIEHTGPWNPRPRQYEFARLALEYTVMSKRKLLQLVKEGHVRGWDDPRMPTISGLRRRGYSPEAIRAFADMIGVAKANSMVDIGKLEYCVRDDLNQTAPRVLGVLRPIEVELEGLPDGVSPIDAPYFPADVGKPGSRSLTITGRVFIDRDDWHDDPPKDYQRFAPGRTVRLRYGPCITADEVERDAAGQVTKLRATVVPDTFGKNPEGVKVSGVIHWVDAATSVPAEVRLYSHLMKVAKPEEGGGDFLQMIDQDSLEVVTTARVEASLAKAEVGSRWQLERVGYFIVDQDAAPGALVLNRIITLRESTEKKVEISAPPKEKKVSAKQQRRIDEGKSKGKSPAEFRLEARARDPELLQWHTDIAAMGGVSAAQADLITGDRVTAKLFLDTVNAGCFPELTAKWIINELPRALDGKELEEVNLGADRFAELIRALGLHEIQAPTAKTALAEMIATGKRFAEVKAPDAAPIGVAELGSKAEALIAAHADKAAQVKAGKHGLLGFFVGQLIKAAPGADPKTVNDILRSRLGLPPA